jgi:malate dehydrogenase (oxaloacetate-decarboxylating)
VEEALKTELDIPVFHDDQHGTAIVTLAALYNALKIVNKKIEEIKVVINGAGAAALAIAKIFIATGVCRENMIVLDSVGALYQGRPGMNPYKEKMALITNLKKLEGRIETVISGADVFIGVSVANILKKEWVDLMADNPIVFAMANPDPEINLNEVKKTKSAVFGTGRSDCPNQINNVLAFPGIFRGALDCRARQITEEMKLAAAKTIASLVSKKELSKDFIIPQVFDRRVAKKVAEAVRKACQ